MKSYQLLLAIGVIIHLRCSPLDDWHASLYEIAERLDVQEDAKDQVCKKMLSLELRVVACAHDREIVLRTQAKNKAHLRGYSITEQYSWLRKQCFDESLFCGYGIFLYSVLQYENFLEHFLVHRAIDLTTLSTVEQLRRVIIDLLKVEQLKLFSTVGNNGYDVQFGLDYFLAWAAWCGSSEVVLLLAEQGADIVRCGHFAIEATVASLGDSPEDMREEKGKILHYLINKGAQVSRTAYQLAQKNCPKNDKIITLLLQHIPAQTACAIM